MLSATEAKSAGETAQARLASENGPKLGFRRASAYSVQIATNQYLSTDIARIMDVQMMGCHAKFKT